MFLWLGTSPILLARWILSLGISAWKKRKSNLFLDFIIH